VAAVRDALREAGVDADKYAGPSFRIGAATPAGRIMGIRGLHHSNIGRLEELGISGVHPHPKTTAGEVTQPGCAQQPKQP